METKKKSGISALDFFFIGFGAIVGVGWAVSINRWMVNSGGPLPASLGYIVALVIMVPIALCYCELCPMLPVSGGGMAYAHRAFGEKISFVSGWATLGAFITIIPFEAIYVADILSILFPFLKSGEPLYTLVGADIYIGHIVVGSAISVILFFINRKGLASSAMLQRVLCFILTGAGIIAIICSTIKFDFANLMPIYENTGDKFHSNFLGGMISILATVPFFIAGFETIPQAIESAGGDTKSVGKSVALTVILSCFFYALLLFTLGGALPWQQFAALDSPAAARLFLEIYAGPVGTVLYIVILVGAIAGLLTTWNGFMMASAQMMMSMGRASMIPGFFAQQHPKYDTPTNALLFCTLFAIAGPFLGMGLIDPLTTFSGGGFVLSWMITAFCLVRLRKKEPDLARPYKIPGGKPMAWFAGISAAVLLVLLFLPGNPVYMGSLAVSLFVGWMAVGVVLYLATGKERSRYTMEERMKHLFSKM